MNWPPGRGSAPSALIKVPIKKRNGDKPASAACRQGAGSRLPPKPASQRCFPPTRCIWLQHCLATSLHPGVGSPSLLAARSNHPKSWGLKSLITFSDLMVLGSPLGKPVPCGDSWSGWWLLLLWAATGLRHTPGAFVRT